MHSILNHEVVCFGEVLWDVLPTGPLPGGAPMNVAYHLKKLGTSPALITRIGFDNYGERLVNVLASNGLSSEYFSIDYQHPTGIVYANANDHNEVVYDIVFPSAWDFIEYSEELSNLVKKSQYFVFGSLASRNKTSRECLNSLLEAANTRVLDINLRAPHYRREEVEFLLSQADILKMNSAELELITGWFSHFQNLEDRIALMQEKFNIKTLIVTMGGDGAIVYHEGKFYHHHGFPVQVADTIGSGDSFLAAFLHQLLAGASIAVALEFAAATGALVATKTGACPDYTLENIKPIITAEQATKYQNI